MDPLLSLCNLHAEGPRTRRMLVSRGVDTLRAVLALPPERLAELLGDSPAAARRFQREAALASAGALRRDPEESVRVPRDDAESGTSPRLRAADRAPHALDVDVGMHAERASAHALPAGHRAALPRRAAFARAEVAPAPRAPAPALARAAQPGDLLRPDLLAGLDVRTCECLVAEGVRTLGQLASLPPARLALLAGLPLALVTGLCADAARLAAGTPRADGHAPAASDPRETAGANTHAAERVVEWTPAPPRRAFAPRATLPELVDVAGPFAGGVEELAAKDWLAARES